MKRVLQFLVSLSLASSVLSWIAPPAHATTTTYSQFFSAGSLSASSSQGLAWDSFRASLTGTYDRIEMSSTYNSFSLVLTDSVKVPQIATALKNGTAINITIGSTIVSIGACNGVEFTAYSSNSTCSCPSAAGVFTLRPTIGNENWGGAGGATCSGTNQTLTLSFTISSPTPTTFSTSQTSPTNISSSGDISYILTLSQSVSDLTASDFQFGGTSSCNTPGLSGSGTSYTISLTNCSEGTLVLQLKANSVTGTSAGPPTVASANTIVIDRTAPTISSVTAPANKTYIPSETPTFTVAFSESMTVTGTPKLTLNVGTSTTKFANFVSFSDSKTALFRYTVGTTAGEFDTDGILMIGAIDQISGSFKDLAGNSLSSALFTPPTLTSVLVAQPASAPTITSITPSSTQLSVAFTAGAANGSTTSTYQYSTNNGGSWSTRSTGSTGSPLVISNLTDGTGYTIRIRAVTNAGNSDSSTAVTETPTAISVTGDATLVITYGNSGSTSAYSANGGNNSFTWTLGSSISGVSISGTIVTASSSLAAGTYAQSVRATDTSGGVGTKSLTITVNKALTSISIALPNSTTSAAASGTVTITATVPRAGAVNFKLGGSTIAGCGSQAAASTTATCSWTAPGTLGTVTLTAVFTPTDSANYETSTSTNFNVTIVNGVSTISLSLTGGVTQASKGQAINIIAAIDQAGKVTFLVDGKRIPGCYNVSANVGNKSCSWRPTAQAIVTITATLNPTSNVYQSSSSSMKVLVTRRTGLR